MRIDQLTSLTDDELSMLWGCINLVEPKILNAYTLDPELFVTIRHSRLMDRLMYCKPKIKQEHQLIFDGLLNKLKISS